MSQLRITFSKYQWTCATFNVLTSEYKAQSDSQTILLHMSYSKYPVINFEACIIIEIERDLSVMKMHINAKSIKQKTSVVFFPP